MHNNLGTVTGSSFLNIQDLAPGDTGRGAAGRGGTATSVIVVAVVSCVLGTSAVWLAIIWYVRARARARRRDWAGELEVKDAETPTTAAPLLGDPKLEEEEAGSERDSGTGDSKQSGEAGDSIVDAVIHNFLSARGEGGLGPAAWVNTTSLSDFDTGISSLGESVARGPASLHSLHRRGCPKVKSLSGQQQAGPQVAAQQPGLAAISYAVDNPLYDALPCARTAPDSEAAAEDGNSDVTSSEATASLISDSVAYCGRFPAKERPQEAEDAVSSVASSVRSVAVSDQPITFNTFHPHLPCPAPCPAPSTASSGKQRKRLSAIETPTGETFLEIGLSTVSAATLEQDVAAAAILAAKEYRGGGTLPRNGLQQEWLEASLKYTEDQSKLELRQARDRERSRDRSSRRSFFRRESRRRSGGRERDSAAERGSLHRARRRSTGSGSVSVAGSVCLSNDEHSTVGSKTRDMF